MDTAASHLPPHTQLEPGTRLSPCCADPTITEPRQPAQRWPERTVPWAANELGNAREWGLLLFTLPRCWVGREVLSSTLSRSGGSIGFPRYSLWGEHGVRGGRRGVVAARTPLEKMLGLPPGVRRPGSTSTKPCRHGSGAQDSDSQQLPPGEPSCTQGRVLWREQGKDSWLSNG